jgi:sugar phosphate permease
MPIVRSFDKLVRWWLTSAKSAAENLGRAIIFAIVMGIVGAVAGFVLKMFAFLIPIAIALGVGVYLWDVYKESEES